jgi:hypothetical protein
MRTPTLDRVGRNSRKIDHIVGHKTVPAADEFETELGHYDESFNSSLQASDGDLSSYSFHMADQGTDAMEREVVGLMI